jgi:hypothetical protein
LLVGAALKLCDACCEMVAPTPAAPVPSPEERQAAEAMEQKAHERAQREEANEQFCRRASAYLQKNFANDPIRFRKGGDHCKCTVSEELATCSYWDGRDIEIGFSVGSDGVIYNHRLLKPLVDNGVGELWGPCKPNGRCNPVGKYLDKRMRLTCAPEGICGRQPGTLYGTTIDGACLLGLERTRGGHCCQPSRENEPCPVQ